MPIPGDDDVVMDSDAEQLANLGNLLGWKQSGIVGNVRFSKEGSRSATRGTPQWH